MGFSLCGIFLIYSSTCSCNKYLLTTNPFAKLFHVIRKTNIVPDFMELIVQSLNFSKVLFSKKDHVSLLLWQAMSKTHGLGYAKNSEVSSFSNEWYLPPETKDEIISAEGYGIYLWVSWQLRQKEKSIQLPHFHCLLPSHCGKTSLSSCLSTWRNLLKGSIYKIY